MIHYLLPKEGNFYKANLHTHSNISDGAWTPAEIKQEYKKRGYSIISITDHELLIPHPELCDKDFLAITGVEVALGSGPYSYTPSVHLNLLAKDPTAEVYPTFSEHHVWLPSSKQYVTDKMRKVDYIYNGYNCDTLNKIIRLSNEAGFLVCLNHPRGSLQSFRDYGSLRGLWGVECYNTSADDAGLCDTIIPTEDLLRGGERVMPVAADDSHDSHHIGGYTQIKAKSLEYGDVMRALQAGDFYSTTGPEISELYFENGRVHIECGGVKSIILNSAHRFAKSVKASGSGPIRSADFDIGELQASAKKYSDSYGKNEYFRLTLTDFDGRVAYTRAYFIDELR